MPLAFREENGVGRDTCRLCVARQAIELAGMVNRLEQELVERRASLTHLDATMRLFHPPSAPGDPTQTAAGPQCLVPGLANAYG